MVTSVRLFLALWPGPRACAALQVCREAWSWSPGSVLVPSGQLHLTLHFLGNVPGDGLPAITQALRVPFRSFELGFGWPRLWRNGLAVLEPSAVPAGLLEVHGALGVALGRLGLPMESRAFRPHVTLARRAGKSSPPRKAPCFEWRVRGYVLVQSVAGHYRILERYS